MFWLYISMFPHFYAVGASGITFAVLRLQNYKSFFISQNLFSFCTQFVTSVQMFHINVHEFASVYSLLIPSFFSSLLILFVFSPVMIVVYYILQLTPIGCSLFQSYSHPPTPPKKKEQPPRNHLYLLPSTSSLFLFFSNPSSNSHKKGTTSSQPNLFTTIYQ